MNPIFNWTSTGNKLVHHPEVIWKLRRRLAAPISLQIAPTSRCNLNCSFCSNANRTKHEDLSNRAINQLLREMKTLGAKTVEWTGGGDPTMYRYIADVMRFAHALNYEQGFITNGIRLSELELDLHVLKWLRISMNCLDYVRSVDIPEIPGTLGFSYVMNESTNVDVLSRLEEHVKKYNPSYVRIVTNCLATVEEQAENNEKYMRMVSSWGRPYFYQPKTFEQSSDCYWCYIKPMILHDGYVYPCSSVVLNSGADGKFNEKFRWVTIKDLPKMYDREIVPFDGSNCNHCVFKGQNDHISSIINPTGMENFV